MATVIIQTEAVGWPTRVRASSQGRRLPSLPVRAEANGHGQEPGVCLGAPRRLEDGEGRLAAGLRLKRLDAVVRTTMMCGTEMRKW